MTNIYFTSTIYAQENLGIKPELNTKTHNCIDFLIKISIVPKHLHHKAMNAHKQNNQSKCY